MNKKENIFESLCKEAINETHINIDEFIKECARKDLCVESVIIGLLNESMNIAFKFASEPETAISVIASVFHAQLSDKNLINDELCDIFCYEEGATLH
jgi:hypothetical protein